MADTQTAEQKLAAAKAASSAAAKNGNDPTATKTAISTTTLSGALAAPLKSALGITDSRPINVQNNDRRARLRPKPGAEGYVYGDTTQSGLMSILRETNGLMFPITPTISETHAVQYSTYSPTHSITKFNSYNNTENVTLQISGDFVVTNATEARYLLACIHFVRSVMKMDFGFASPSRGTPPPVLIFSAYGTFMYNDIPVVVKGANFSMDPDVDYIQVPLLGTSTDFGRDLLAVSDFFERVSDRPERVWVPSKLTLSLSLEQQVTSKWLVDDFNLNSFKRGELLTKGGMI